MLRPRVRTVPPANTSALEETIDLCLSAKLLLDPWQQLVLEHALGENEDGKWSAFEVGLVVPRQNGKGTILEARELAGLFILGERTILHSAHEFKTAADHFRRMTQLIQANPTLDAQVATYAGSHGSERIELKNGSRLLFVARTGGSGRGFPADLVVLDEAYNLPQHAMSALIPTLTTSPNPQIWYTSSAVNQEIHPNGHVLARVRRRGLEGKDPALCYLEWSVDEVTYEADPETVVADPRAWAAANPSLGSPRLTLDYVEKERGALTLQSFAVERLGVGDWPNDEAIEQVIPSDVWKGIVMRPTEAVAPLVFSIDVPPSRATASFATARYHQGRLFVESIPRPATATKGTGWVLDRAIELNNRWKPTAWVIDRLGPGGTLIDKLTEAGLPVQTTDGTEMAAACGGFYDDALAGVLAHGDQIALNQALAAATTRKLLDRWAWNRTGITDISPLVAATLARYGLLKYGKPKVVAPPIVEDLGSGSAGGIDDLATIHF